MTSCDARTFFEAVAGRYERTYALPADESRARMARVLAELPPPPGRVLDLGVGPGRELPALLDAGYEPVGVDVSPAMLERCARRARPIPLVEADFWQPLPFDAASFDAAVALHGTLAHPPDAGALGRLAAELARVVRPGGTWVTEVPSPAWVDHAVAAGSVRRTGPSSGVHTDPVTGASIEARLLDAAGWAAALAPGWIVEVRCASDVEWLVLARRAR